MKFAIVPALSALLLAGLPAQAQTSLSHSWQIAQNNPDDHGNGRDKPGKPNKPNKPGDVRSVPAVVPAGSVDAGHNPSGQGGGHPGRGQSGGAGGAPAGVPSGLFTGGQGGTPPAGGHGGAGGAPTSGPAAGGAPTGGPAAGAHGGIGRGPAGGPPPGGAPAGLFTGGQGGTPPGAGLGGAGGATGRHTPGGAITGGDRGTTFGTRPSNWNRYPRTFDTGTYRRNMTAQRHFHWQTYNRPSGWYYRRWVFGQIFPRTFWAQDYWLTDYWMFDLPIPPYGYVWVRYGDDALLVNKRTGQVLQVVYDLFD